MHSRGAWGTLGGGAPQKSHTGLSRRELLGAGAAGAAYLLAGQRAEAAPATVPVAVSSANGLRTVEKACERVAAGDKPVHAAVQGVSIVEDDPDDMTVGYGGRPNERGVVQLDSCAMDGTRGLSGAVAALEDIGNPSQVALKVLERTDHCLLVGKGAYEFARVHGFPKKELLTEKARQAWLKWKETLSPRDDWIAPHENGGTITCLTRDPKQAALGGCTTTSGLAWKIPGRVGDSPIIGAGLYVDDTGGAAGCTGRGEAAILTCASFLAVETMRRGASPTEAALETCKRMAARTKIKRLLDERGRPAFNVVVYCLGKDGSHGAASIWSGKQYAVRDAEGARLEDAAFLYKRS